MSPPQARIGVAARNRPRITVDRPSPTRPRRRCRIASPSGAGRPWRRPAIGAPDGSTGEAVPGSARRALDPDVVHDDLDEVVGATIRRLDDDPDGFTGPRGERGPAANPRRPDDASVAVLVPDQGSGGRVVLDEDLEAVRGTARPVCEGIPEREVAGRGGELDRDAPDRRDAVQVVAVRPVARPGPRDEAVPSGDDLVGLEDHAVDARRDR